MPTSVDLSDNTRELLAERASRSSLALPPSDVTDDVSVLLGTALELPVLRNVDLHEDGSGSEGWGRAGRWREACKEVDRYKQTNERLQFNLDYQPQLTFRFLFICQNMKIKTPIS